MTLWVKTSMLQKLTYDAYNWQKQTSDQPQARRPLINIIRHKMSLCLVSNNYYSFLWKTITFELWGHLLAESYIIWLKMILQKPEYKILAMANKFADQKRNRNNLHMELIWKCWSTKDLQNRHESWATGIFIAVMFNTAFELNCQQTVSAILTLWDSHIMLILCGSADTNLG